MDQILALLDKVIGAVGMPTVVTVVVFIFELIGRLVPTGKPISFMIAVQGVLKIIIAIFGKIAAVASAIDDLIGKVIPQNVK
jgi:hypothetical protein